MTSTASNPPLTPTAVPQASTSARRPSFRMRAIQVAIPTVQTSAYIQSSAATPRYWLDNPAPLASSSSSGSPTDCVHGHGHPACARSDADAPATPTRPRVSTPATRKSSIHYTLPMDGAAEMRSPATAPQAVMNSPVEPDDDRVEYSHFASMESSRARLPVDESGEDAPRLIKLARRRHVWYEQWWRDAGRGHGQTNSDTH